MYYLKLLHEILQCGHVFPNNEKHLIKTKCEEMKARVAEDIAAGDVQASPRLDRHSGSFSPKSSPKSLSKGSVGKQSATSVEMAEEFERLCNLTIGLLQGVDAQQMKKQFNLIVENHLHSYGLID